MTETIESVEVDVDLEAVLPCDGYTDYTYTEKCPNVAEWRITFATNCTHPHQTNFFACTPCKEEADVERQHGNYFLCNICNNPVRIVSITHL